VKKTIFMKGEVLSYGGGRGRGVGRGSGGGTDRNKQKLVENRILMRIEINTYST